MSGLLALGSRAAARWGRGRLGAQPPATHRRRVPDGAPAGVTTLPPGWDAARLLDAACARFRELQAAWDAGDVAALAALTTAHMLDELREVRASCRGDNRTGVLGLEAQLRCFEALDANWLLAVEFSGNLSEWPERGTVPFRELWWLTCERGASPGTAHWRLAGLQALA